MSQPPADEALVLTQDQLVSPSPEPERRVTVPEAETLRIALPRMPRGRSDLVAMIGDRVPLPVRDLAWTAPRPTGAGEAEVTVARKATVGALQEQFGSGTPVYDPHSGLPFELVERADLRSNAITFAVCALAIAVSAWAVGTAPGEADSAARTSQRTVPSAAAGPAFARAGIGEPLDLAAGLVARGLVLIRIGSGTDGALQVDLASDDPDGLRAKLAGDPDLGTFREVSQVRAPQGGYRISYEGGAAGPPASTIAVAPLGAADAFAAAQTIESQLQGLAAARAVKITLATTRPSAARPLEFSLELAGPQDDVLAVARAIEGSERPMRFPEWSLAPDGEGVRFSASLVVPWVGQP